jgi:hypothetical protein
MVMKLSKTLSHVTTVLNSINSNAITEFYNYMKSIGTYENYQNQNLKAIIGYARFLGVEITFYDMSEISEIVLAKDATSIIYDIGLQELKNIGISLMNLTNV